MKVRRWLKNKKELKKTTTKINNKNTWSKHATKKHHMDIYISQRQFQRFIQM